MKNGRGKISAIIKCFKKHIAPFSICAVIVAILLSVVIFILPFFMRSEVVSREELKDYIKEYSSEYRGLVEENMALLDRPFAEGTSKSSSSNLTFYWNPPDRMEGVISRTHGAAVFFNHSDAKSVQIVTKEFPEPIEYYVWPKMVKDTSGLPIVRIMKAEGYYHLDSQVSCSYGLLYVDPGANLRYTREGKAFNISGQGAIVIFGSLIHEDRMILKGTNNKEDWSKTQARFDALSEFVWDCRDILNTTMIEKIDSEYRLPILLEKMALRMKSGHYRDNPNLFREDFEELEKICSSNETLSKVLNEYYDVQKTPSLPEQLSDLWDTYMVPIVTATIAGIIAGIVSIYYKIHISRTKKKTLRTQKSSSDKKQKSE